jgi:hypothetical protein
MIRQLTTLAIQTGSPGSIAATIALLVYLNNPDGNSVYFPPSIISLADAVQFLLALDLL